MIQHYKDQVERQRFLFGSHKDTKLLAEHLEVISPQGPFEHLNVRGFVNTGVPKKKSCDELSFNGTFGAQKSIHLDVDIRAIAKMLDGHEKVDYADHEISNPDFTVDQLMEKYWRVMSGSSVWMPDHGVYLMVTRVAFGPDWWLPDISFLRGQIYSEAWEALDGYELQWNNKTITFPHIFDIPIPTHANSKAMGTEDPRVILEDNVPNAEPVIIFNMLAPMTDWKRAMWLYRPFTGHLTVMTIMDIYRARSDTEKNWAPFFVPEYSETEPDLRVPNRHIHFIYRNKQLVVLRCSLDSGTCIWAFEQTIPEGLFLPHKEEGGDLRGGTNFIPVPLHLPSRTSRLANVYLGFPRTHIESGCGAFYRPELVVLIRVDDDFFFTFASESIDFGNALIQLEPHESACSRGRIMIPMSIARWDLLSDIPARSTDKEPHVLSPFVNTDMETDVVTATFSVDDKSIQVMRIAGLLAFIRTIPQVKALQKLELTEPGDALELSNMANSWVAHDLRSCLVESAIDYVEVSIKPKHKESQDVPEDLPIPASHEFHQKERLEREKLKAQKLVAEAERAQQAHNQEPKSHSTPGPLDLTDPDFEADEPDELFDGAEPDDLEESEEVAEKDRRISSVVDAAGRASVDDDDLAVDRVKSLTANGMGNLAADDVEELMASDRAEDPIDAITELLSL
jgi:hypothetical protein